MLSLFYFGIINKMWKGKDSILVFSRKKIRYWFSCASVVLLCVGYARPYVSLDVSLTPDWQVSTKSTQKSEIRILGSEAERAGNVAQEVKDKKALSSKQLELEACGLTVNVSKSLNQGCSSASVRVILFLTSVVSIFLIRSFICKKTVEKQTTWKKDNI